MKWLLISLLLTSCASRPCLRGHNELRSTPAYITLEDPFHSGISLPVYHQEEFYEVFVCDEYAREAP